MEATSGQGNERREKNNTRIPPPPPEPLKQCPRCFSFDTRFCYYNNGCSSQPRYLCKSCKRHWTVGGALRDIPIGGGSRKGSKRLKSSPSSHDHASSSNLVGESSTSREQLQPPQPSPSPPPAPLLPPHISGYSNMSLPPANSLYSVPAGGNFSSLSRILNDLNRPQGFNQAPLNGVGSVGGESSTNFSFLQGFTRNPNLVSQQLGQQSNYQTLQTEETMAEPSFSSSFWSQGLTNNVDWAENMLLQPRNNFWSASLNKKPADVDEDDHLPGGGKPPPSS